MLITPHFTFDEMTVSQLAARDGFDNTPPPEARANLQLLCGALEQVRALFGAPIIVSSGFRSEKVNRLIGGATNSQHVQGLAADFTVIEVSLGKPCAGSAKAPCRSINSSWSSTGGCICRWPRARRVGRS